MENNKDRLPQERFHPELKKYAKIKWTLTISLLVYAVFSQSFRFFIEIQNQYILFGLVVFIGGIFKLITIFEKKTLKSLYDLPQFDYWIRGFNPNDKRWKTLFWVASILLFFILSLFGEYYMIFFIALIFPLIFFYYLFFFELLSFKLHFCEELIMKDGVTKEFLFWSEFEEIEDSPEDEYFELVFKDGERIKIGYEPYYTQDLGRKKIFQYIEAILAKEKSNDL